VHTGVSLLKRPEVGPLGSIHELVADATRVAAAGTDGSAWSWSSATPVHVSGGVFDRGQLHFNADGMLVVVTTTPRATPRVERYRGDPPALVDATDVPHKAALGIGAITAGDRLVVEEVLDHSYRRVAYDLAGKAAPVHFVAWSPKSPQTGDMHDEGLDGGAMTRDLARAYIYGELQALHAWDVKTGTLVAVAPAPKGGRSTAVTLSPDEAHVAIGSVAGEVDVYRAKDLKLEHTLTDAKRRVHATAIAGELVVAAADDGLFAWRIDTGALVATIDFAASNEQPTALAFTPDGTTLWVGTSLGNVHRFSVHAP
jgi:WD40 repeat protein